MYAEKATAGISVLKNSLSRGKNKFLSFMLAMIVVSYIAIPDNTAGIGNQERVESTGLIAVNYFQFA